MNILRICRFSRSCGHNSNASTPGVRRVIRARDANSRLRSLSVSYEKQGCGRRSSAGTISRPTRSAIRCTHGSSSTVSCSIRPATSSQETRSSRAIQGATCAMAGTRRSTSSNTSTPCSHLSCPTSGRRFSPLSSTTTSTPGASTNESGALTTCLRRLVCTQMPETLELAHLTVGSSTAVSFSSSPSRPLEGS
jgi:hypothetical protein